MDPETATYDFSLLPPHIITNILSHLPVHQLTNLTTVCRAWYAASFSRVITEKIALRLYDNACVDRFIDSHIVVRPFASVYFSGTKFNQLNYRNFFEKFGKNIRHLEFRECEIEFDQLIECIGLVDRLESLTIETRHGTNWNKNVKMINITDGLINNLSGVKTLSIRCGTHQDFAAIHLILSKCINLDSLTYVIALKNDCNDDVREIYENLISAMNQWDRVDLSFLSIENDASAVCDTFFTSFQLLNVIRLQTLNLRNIRIGYDSKSFDQFCAGMYDIEDLDCEIKTLSNLSNICQYMPHLTRLSINAMCTEFIGVIGKLERLELLEIAAFNVPELELRSIFNAKRPKLRKLSLNIMCVNKACLVALCNNFKNLEYLNVTLNTKCCYPIFQNLRNLKHLTIYLEPNKDDTFDKENSNILELQKLERLYIDELMPGMTADQIAKLNLKFYKCMADN